MDRYNAVSLLYTYYDNMVLSFFHSTETIFYETIPRVLFFLVHELQGSVLKFSAEF